MKKLILILSVMISTVGFSQVEKGDINATFNALYLGGDGFGVGIISGKVGYFFTQNIEGGVTPSITFMTFGGDGDTSPGIGFYGTYNFLTSDGKLLPYAGGSIDFISSQGSNFTALGVYGGAKYFLTEALNIDGGIKLLSAEGQTLFLTQVGIGFIIGKLK